VQHLVTTTGLPADASQKLLAVAGYESVEDINRAATRLQQRVQHLQVTGHPAHQIIFNVRQMTINRFPSNPPAFTTVPSGLSIPHTALVTLLLVYASVATQHLSTSASCISTSQDSASGSSLSN
jgi:hypothetical protein